MQLHLIRHARAEKQADWDGPAPLRPLSPRGVRQAHALAERLEAAGIELIVSSPHLRCRQTVEPLAKRLGLRVQLDERLAEGEPAAKARQLLGELGDRRAACCSHGPLITALVAELEEQGAALHVEGPLRSEKGSSFRVEGQDGKPIRIQHEAPPDPGPGGATEALRIGVVDLGSTSFRLVVFEATAAGRLTPVLNERTMLRLGAAIALDGRLSEEACAQAEETAHDLAEHARQARVDRLLPVGTAALRDAANGAALCARLGSALGAPVRLLTGEEEARLMFRSFRRRVLLGQGPTLGVDLGGGSLEMAIGDAQDLHWEATLRLGVTRLHRELAHSDPMRGRERKAVRARVEELLAPHRDLVLGHAPRLCVASGGTARAVARLVVARRGLRPSRSIDQTVIPREEVVDLSRLLTRASHEERLRLSGMRRNRADLLPTGTLILRSVAELLELEAFTVCDWGLREGVVLEALASEASS